MKKKVLLALLLLQLGGVSLLALQRVNLIVGYDDLDPSIPSLPKTPPHIPVVELDGNQLIFEADHAAFTLDIIQNGEAIYTVSVPEEATTITLPSWIEGECELRLSTGGSFYFYVYITL